MNVNNIALPDKLSDLILVALADLERAEQSPNVHINMGDWRAFYKYTQNQYCSVCFAGAVMIGTLNLSKKRSGFPGFGEGVDGQTKSKLYALDYVQAGSIALALCLLDVPVTDRLLGILHIPLCPYAQDSKIFKSDIHSLVVLLKNEGL